MQSFCIRDVQNKLKFLRFNSTPSQCIDHMAHSFSSHPLSYLPPPPSTLRFLWPNFTFHINVQGFFPLHGYPFLLRPNFHALTFQIISQFSSLKARPSPSFRQNFPALIFKIKVQQFSEGMTISLLFWVQYPAFDFLCQCSVAFSRHDTSLSSIHTNVQCFSQLTGFKTIPFPYPYQYAMFLSVNLSQGITIPSHLPIPMYNVSLSYLVSRHDNSLSSTYTNV